MTSSTASPDPGRLILPALRANADGGFGHEAARIAAGGRVTIATVAAADTAGAPAGTSGVTPAPLSSLLPAKANELDGSPGAGSPSGSGKHPRISP